MKKLRRNLMRCLVLGACFLGLTGDVYGSIDGSIDRAIDGSIDSLSG